MPSTTGEMTCLEAFHYLKARVKQLQKIPVEGCTYAEREEEAALIIALSAMKDLSSCFPPDEMIKDDLPVSRD